MGEITRQPKRYRQRDVFTCLDCPNTFTATSSNQRKRCDNCKRLRENRLKRENDKRRIAETVASELQGTAQSLTEALEKINRPRLESDQFFCDRLNELVFCCDECGWWCEMSEMSSADMICEECADE